MKRALILILGIILIFSIVGYILYTMYNMRVTAVFEELEPFPKNINVYYRGFKFGRTIRVYPSEDFKSTYVDMILNVKGINLPDNITAKVKVKNKKDYIEIIYPDEPSITYLQNHSVIEGKTCKNLSSYIDSQAEDGSLDELRDNLNTTVQAAGGTFNALTDLIGTANDILKDLKPSLIKSGDNLAAASQSLAEVSEELNQSSKPKKFKNIFDNIEQTTINIERSTRNFESASLYVSDITKNANRETIALVNCLIKNINTVVNNINDIVKGFKHTLSSRFGGMKIMFGKPIS